MKREMPDAAPARNLRKLLPRLTRNRDIEDREFAHLSRMRAGVRIGHRSAPIVADEEDFLETELAHQLIDIIGDRPFVVAGNRSRRITEAAHVGRDYRVALGERGHDAAPFEPRLRPSV